MKKHPILRFISSVFLVLLFCGFFAGAAYAYKNYVSVHENEFQTGTLEINLNDGHALLYGDEYYFEPGITVKKDFFVKNEGTLDAYYKLYFSNVGGALADFLEVTIKEDETVLYKGKLKALSRENVSSAKKILLAGETHNLTVAFYLPTTTGNVVQSKDVSFDFCVDAVQAKNNPLRFFE